MADMVCCMLLSHSSQEKKYYQKRMKLNEEVSDECSSGVVRVVHVDHSIPAVLCMQVLARDKRKLEAPSSIDEKRTLEEGVQRLERWIQRYKEALERNERALSIER